MCIHILVAGLIGSVFTSMLLRLKQHSFTLSFSQLTLFTNEISHLSIVSRCLLAAAQKVASLEALNLYAQFFSLELDSRTHWCSLGVPSVCLGLRRGTWPTAVRLESLPIAVTEAVRIGGLRVFEF